MKKYFKHKEVDLYLIEFKSGVMSVNNEFCISWFSNLQAENLNLNNGYTECTREECEAAYKQTIQFLNDKINGN